MLNVFLLAIISVTKSDAAACNYFDVHRVILFLDSLYTHSSATTQATLGSIKVVSINELPTRHQPNKRQIQTATFFS